ncbi:MAG TPA: peptidoglycan DD-metalloendopeptidase family protein [Magnetospirillaceae bacterium]
MALAVASAGVARAENMTSSEPQPSPAKLKALESELKKSQAESDKAAKAAADAAHEADTVRGDEVGTAHAIQENEEALSDLEQQLKGLDKDEREKTEALELRREQMSGVITALARLAFRPSEALIGQPTSPADTVRSAILLREEVPRLQAAAAQLKADLDAVAQVRTAIATQRKKIAATSEKLDADHKHLATLYTKKAEIRDQAEVQRHVTADRVSILANQAQDVRDLLAKIDADKAAQQKAQEEAQQQAREQARREKEEQATAERAAEAQAKAERAKREQIMAMNAPAPPPPPKPVQTPAAQPKSEPSPKPDLKPQAKSEPPVSESPVPAPQEQPAAVVRPLELRPFSHAEGKMPFPARGHVVIHFGQAGDGGLPAKGITIETRAGAQVVTPYDGDVVFAGPFRGYGLLLIIEHAEGYHTLLAGMARIDSAVGQRLVAGEPVGVMDVSEDKPLLYVELRHSGQPINPLPWLMARKSKVGE